MLARGPRHLRLVRHTEVSPEWRGRCYGATDVGLSAEGERMAAAVVESLALEPADVLITSGLARTMAIADPLAARLGLTPRIDPRWRELDFGAWEGRSWAAIFLESGAAMNGLIEAPGTFRPGGGETTHALRDRVLAAYDALPPGARVIVITHGGPIAALRGTLGGLPVGRWPGLVPKPGATITLPEQGNCAAISRDLTH